MRIRKHLHASLETETTELAAVCHEKFDRQCLRSSFQRTTKTSILLSPEEEGLVKLAVGLRVLLEDDITAIWLHKMRITSCQQGSHTLSDRFPVLIMNKLKHYPQPWQQSNTVIQQEGLRLIQLRA